MRTMSHQSDKKAKTLMFLMGLGACTKVYIFGIFSFTELVIFPLAPFLYMKHYQELRRLDVTFILNLTWIMDIGCLLATLLNGCHPLVFLKTVAIYYSIFAWCLAYLLVLRQSLHGLGHFFLGYFISTIISIFAFNPQIAGDLTTSVEIVQMDVEEAIAGVMFWYPKIMQVIRFPIIADYFATPSLYPMIALPAGIVMMMMISSSGRSASAATVVALMIIMIGRKSRQTMQLIGRHFIVGLVILMMVGGVLKSVYAKLAVEGTLGEEAQRKYVSQSVRGNSMLSLLIAGRTEFFTTIWALLDSPIIGIGPMAVDTKGYRVDFIKKYGTAEEEERFYKELSKGWIPLIPQHSYLTQFWGQAGISGLVFWVVVMGLMYQYFKRYAPAIPQWYGYFALNIPSTLWAIFFSPYTERATFPLLLACLLLARALGRGKIVLPYDMEMQARRYDK